MKAEEANQYFSTKLFNCSYPFTEDEKLKVDAEINKQIKANTEKILNWSNQYSPPPPLSIEFSNQWKNISLKRYLIELGYSIYSDGNGVDLIAYPYTKSSK